MPIKEPILGRLYKIISRVNFVKSVQSVQPNIKNVSMDVGHVVLISYKPAYPGYPTIRWEYILPDGQFGYHHNSEIDSFWEYFKEV